jgi:hypothetical protein
MGVSHAAFGRLVGVSHQAVGKAIHSGRLIHSVLKDGTIDPALGVVEWERISPVSERPIGIAGTDPSVGRQASVARGAKAFYEAKLLELEYKKKLGEVISVKEMRDTVGELTRRARDQLLSMAARLAPVLAGTTGTQECYSLIEREVYDALDALASMSDAEDNPTSPPAPVVEFPRARSLHRGVNGHS